MYALYRKLCAVGILVLGAIQYGQAAVVRLEDTRGSDIVRRESKYPCKVKEMRGVGKTAQDSNGVCFATYCLQGYIWVYEDGSLLKGEDIDAIKANGIKGLPKVDGSPGSPQIITCVKADKMDCGLAKDQCDRPTDTCGAHNKKHIVQCESYIV